MELLLNLIWLVLAVGVMFAFMRGKCASAQREQIPFGRSLIALACVAVLLFPVVSASDDLHPAQAVVEDISKRVQLAVAPLHLVRTSPTMPMLPLMLALCLMSLLVILQLLRPAALRAQVLDGTIMPSAGRAPPSCWN